MSASSSAMGSISQDANTSALPNFRNLGILLRILVIVNVLAIGTAVARAPTLRDAWSEFVEMSAVVQPIVILTVLALAAGRLPPSIATARAPQSTSLLATARHTRSTHSTTTVVAARSTLAIAVAVATVTMVLAAS